MKGHVVKKRKKGRSQKRLSKVSQHITKCLYHPTKTMTAAFTWLTKKKNLNCKYNVALCFTLWHVTVCALWTLHMGWHPESNMKNCLLQFCTILMKLEACADSLQLITYSPEHTSGIARSDLGTKDELPVFSTKHKEMKKSKTPKIVPWNYSLDIKKFPILLLYLCTMEQLEYWVSLTGGCQYHFTIYRGRSIGLHMKILLAEPHFGGFPWKEGTF